MMQHRIILFCWAFIGGISAAMLRPLPAAWIAPLSLVAIAGAAAAAIAGARSRRDGGGGPAARALVIALAAAGFAFGQARYLAQLRVPDRAAGEIRVRGETVEWRETRPPAGAARYALRAPAGTGAEGVTLRFEGELHARYPERDEKGRPRMDPDGRWRLVEVRVPQSAEVVVPPGLPPGALVSIEPPFSRIAGVRRVAGNGDLRLALIRRPARVAEFARPGRDTTPVTILGRISTDPAVYPFRTVLTVAPDLIQFQPDGPFFEIERGSARVTLLEDVPGYREFARTEVYGRDVWIRGELQLPPAALNPGAFSQRQFLLSQHIEGQMLLRAPRGADAEPIVAIAPDGGPFRRGNPLVRFSLGLRDDLLRVIKQTLPYPNSAFVAAVALGLRYGMQDAETLNSPAYADLPVPPLVPARDGTAPLISFEFRAAGINHVLAVSGLHVTIITAMFVGLFSLLRISRRAYVPVVILAMIVFAIITGARPSTLRAVIMNSLFLVTWAYLSHTLRASVLLGVPVAAFVILVQNPALLVDPSFSLSFGAILSLALLTQPAYDALRRFRGNDLLALALTVVALTAAMIHNWFLIVSWRFWLLFAPATALVFALGRLLTRRGTKPIGDYGFENLPSSVSLFLAAQIGIQLGMMAPLSGFYFQRWASAGAYANLVAIPLIGVIMQIAMLASLLGLVPVVGIFPALVLNAANWLFSSLFILLGHYSAAWFPFPFVRKPSLAGLAAYYALLALIVWRAPLLERLRPRWARLPRGTRRALAWGAPVLLAAAFAGRAVVAGRPDGKLRVTVLSVNYGSAILVQTPGGKAVLVDTGHVQSDRARRNEAEWTILPHLYARGIRSLAWLVLTAPADERTLGTASLVEHLRVGRVLEAARPADGHGASDWFAHAGPTARRRMSWSPWNRLAGTTTLPLLLKPYPAAEGYRSTLVEEDHNGVPFRLEALHARDESGAPYPLVLRIVHGDFSMLLPSDLTLDQQRRLVADAPEALKADVVVAPSRGVYRNEPDEAESERIARAFYAATGAKDVIFEFGNPRPVLGDLGRAALSSHGRHRRIAENYAGRGRVHITDRDGAVRIESDGAAWRLTTQAGGGADDEVSDLEIGL